MVFSHFSAHFTMFIYRYNKLFCIFLNKKESYWYNSGRFGKPWKRATFLVFSIFRLFPFMVTSKSNHVQRKPVANHISVKFYRFCYFYNFWRPWEFITYSHWQLSHIAHHKSNLKQEKLTSECVFINIYSFYNFGEAWEFFDPQVVHILI